MRSLRRSGPKCRMRSRNTLVTSKPCGTSKVPIAVRTSCMMIIPGCTERSAPTGITEKRGPTFSADATGAKASVVFDAIGDAVWNQNTGPGSFAKVPAWLDIASASITLKGLRFIFDEELAAPVPADPALDPDIPPQIDHVCFAGYGLDADPTTAPVGYPFTKNEPNNQEFYVFVCWNPTGSFGVGTGFIGFVVDRRPLLSGGQALIAPVEFSIQGTHVSMVVDAAALGDPATFAWAAFTHLQERPHPPDNGPILDAAPEVLSGAPLATWPQ